MRCMHECVQMNMDSLESRNRQVQDFFEKYDFDGHPSIRRWLAWIENKKNMKSTTPSIGSHFLSKISNSTTFLDFGCGNGWATIYILKRKPNAFGVGIDITAKLVRDAIRNAEKEGIRNQCEFIVCDCTKLPFLHGLFDAIMEFNVIHHLSNIQRALTSLYISLKNGGYVLVAETVTDNLLVLLGRHLNAQLNLSFASGVEANFTSNQLASSLGHVDLNIVRRSYDEYFVWVLKNLARRYPNTARIFPKPLLLILIYLELALQRTPLLRRFGGQILFLCQKS
jgi:SAM-dependent methyltransferase